MKPDFFSHAQLCGCPGCKEWHDALRDAQSASVQPSADTTDANIVAALDSGNHWDTTNGSGTTVVTYTFDSITGPYGNDPDAKGYSLFNAAQRAAAQAAMAEFEKVANVQFVEVPGGNPNNTQMIFREADLPGNIAGWAYYPDADGTDIVVDKFYFDGGNPGDYVEGLEPGNFGFRLFLHEIGHGMGLSHPHEGNPALPSNEDSANASVMSYYDSNAGKIGGAVATRSGPTAPQTLQIYDIAALQAMYGANQAYNAGNTTYTLGSATKVWTLWDGGGEDTLDSSSYSGAVRLDLREGLQFVSEVGGNRFWVAFNANIENAVSGDGNDHLTGNALDNFFKAGAGADTIDGENGQDTLSYANSDDAVNVSLLAHTASGGHAAGDVISDIEHLAGSLHHDTLEGDNLANILIGYAGNDRLIGQGGNDTIYAGQGDDKLFGDAGADKLFGEAGQDVLHGGAGNDSLFGGDDADTAYAGDDADIVYGGNGNDTLYGDAGNDTIYGESGDDRLAGGLGNDVLYGSGGKDVLYGQEGSDKVYGEDGNDLVYGSDGDDTVYGGEGADTMFGGAGSDSLYGGDGLYADVIHGDEGNDTLKGGGGADVFVFGSGSGQDILLDFEDGLDHIDLTALGTSWGAIAGDISASGSNALLDFGLGSVLTFEGLNSGLLDAGDFYF